MAKALQLGLAMLSMLPGVRRAVYLMVAAFAGLPFTVQAMLDHRLGLALLLANLGLLAGFLAGLSLWQVRRDLQAIHKGV